MEKIRELDEAKNKSRPEDLACKACGKTFSPGWNYSAGTWDYPGFDAASGICRRCRRLERIRENIGGCLRAAGVPPKYIGCSFENFKPGKIHEKAFGLCRDYVRNPSSNLFIYGGWGTGKTHMAVAIARELLLIGKEVVFTSIPKLLFEIRKAFREENGDTEATCVEKFASCEFLILDDFGLEKATEWARQTLDYIIYERDNNLKPTVTTSNLSLDEIAQRIDGRISSRLAGMGRIVQFNGPDFRLRRNAAHLAAADPEGKRT